MTIEVGSKVEGKVTGITNFGAFVELPGGITGLIHISEIAEDYVKDVNEHLKLNDKVLVKVINVDEKGKIGLSIKQAVNKPKPQQRRVPQISMDDKINQFFKDSEEKMAALKRSYDSKRGSRGPRKG
ncbi:S1 RNA-binding domain-containing protein [Desulfuribacillus alkaliarsenatis]|uniref:RNA-binding protein S1 n=1 Tax=Desulfuribacillus alkaliarsenatis TaxID=766136 RepID=A0A1E5FZ99_9FIRM|nr:S1 RNA-binding domain-containing protein [Desulfuribacillus alkaliarsenatis]OEF95767.1 RNA-binding protein S1 [Desulfuribacillus alkaliarsenatis]